MVFSFGTTLSVAASAMLYTAVNTANTFECNFNFSAIHKNERNKSLLSFNSSNYKKVTRCALKAQQKREEFFLARNSKIYKQESGQFLKHIVNDANESYLNRLSINQIKCGGSYRYGALFCRSGNWLEISTIPKKIDNNKNITNNSKKVYVRGKKHELDKFIILEFIAVAFGLISMRGAVTKNYLCMNNKGELYAAPLDNYTSECVFFEEMLENYYNLYSSCAYGLNNQSWYIALKKSGKSKKGSFAKKNDKSSHFLFLPLNNDNKKKILNRINFEKNTNNFDNFKKSSINSKFSQNFMNKTKLYLKKKFFNLSLSQKTNLKTNLVLLNQSKNNNYIDNHKKSINILKNNNTINYKNLRNESIFNNLNHKNFLNFTNWIYKNNTANFYNRRKFRKGIRRKKRLLREEKQRKKRRKDLEKLRKNALIGFYKRNNLK